MHKCTASFSGRLGSSPRSGRTLSARSKKANFAGMRGGDQPAPRQQHLESGIPKTGELGEGATELPGQRRPEPAAESSQAPSAAPSQRRQPRIQAHCRQCIERGRPEQKERRRLHMMAWRYSRLPQAGCWLHLQTHDPAARRQSWEKRPGSARLPRAGCRLHLQTHDPAARRQSDSRVEGSAQHWQQRHGDSCLHASGRW